MWKVEIVPDIELVNNSTITQREFVNKHWEKFKPVYIHFHGYCDDADLYLLVVEFWSKIFRSDVQPVFLSDNQIFSYFKTAVRNKNYDVTHKKEIQLITFTDYDDNNFNNIEITPEPFEEKIPDESRPFSDCIESSIDAEKILNELSKRLTEPYMKILALMYGKDRTPNEIRKELGVSITTVRDRICVIRNELNKLIKELDKEEKIFNSQR